MQKKFNDYLDKLFSRRFQILVIAVILFCIFDKFMGEHLVWVFGIYVAASTAQKITGGLKK